MRISLVKSFILLLVTASAVEGFEGGVRGQSDQQRRQEQEKAIGEVRANTNEINGEQQLEQPRQLGDDGGGSSYSDPIMFFLRNGDEGKGEYCLAYDEMGTMVYPDKEDEVLLGLVAARCNASDKKQHWIMDLSRTRAPIRPRKDLSLCIDNLGNRLGWNSAGLKKCAKGKDVVQRMKIATAESVKGAIQTYGSDGWGRSLALDNYYCSGDRYRIKFDRVDVALWDQVDPEDYEGPTSSEIGDLDGDRVLVVSENDMTKCVGTKDLEMEECDGKDKDVLTWLTDGKIVWNPKTKEIFDYNWNNGIARGKCCLEYTEYWRDNEHVGPLFEFGNECESDERRQGFLLVPVDEYEGIPSKPKNIKSDDYVQLQVGSNNMCLEGRYGEEVELVKCDAEKYNIQDEQLWFLERNASDDSLRLRYKKDLTLCLDFGIYIESYSDDDGWKIPRLAKCNPYSNRQEWKYNKKGNSEISHTKVPGYMNKNFCITGARICPYSVCESKFEIRDEPRITPCNGSAKQSWKLIENSKCSKEEAPRFEYPKRDYFLFVSKTDTDRCWERDVTENMGLNLNDNCHMTIPRRHYSQIFYFEDTDNESARRIMSSTQDLCMGVRNDEMKKGTCIDMYQSCVTDNRNQEWLYNSDNGEISPASDADLCVSSNCEDECGWEECGDGRSDCGSFCLRKCNGKTKFQGFKTMSVSDYRKQRDYGKGIDKDDIVMVVLKENPKYCVKVYDNLELQDVVVAKCKVDNAEEHWTFEKEEKGLRWRSVENPYLFIESQQNREGKKLIVNEDMISKDKQHWTIKKDGTIRPAAKDQLCITRDTCKGNIAKNDNVELVACDDDESERMKFDLVRPSEYAVFLKNAIAYGK